MLQGMVIGYMEGDITEIITYTEKFVPKINNWSVCDSFCSGYKHVLRYPEKIWGFIQKYLYCNEEFQIRFGVVMLLNYYIEENRLVELFRIFDSIKKEGYYVKMALAWAISVCYIKYPEESLQYLQDNCLDTFTYNKALQKIIESQCITKEKKNTIRKMKVY